MTRQYVHGEPKQHITDAIVRRLGVTIRAEIATMVNEENLGARIKTDERISNEIDGIISLLADDNFAFIQIDLPQRTMTEVANDEQL